MVKIVVCKNRECWCLFFRCDSYIKIDLTNPYMMSTKKEAVMRVAKLIQKQLAGTRISIEIIKTRKVDL